MPKFHYHVKRWLLEAYEVEVEAEAAPAKEVVADLAEDPYKVLVLNEEVTQIGE